MCEDPRQRIIPREYSIFGGLDVDKKRMAVTFGDHGQLLQSLQMPYSSSHLINYLDKHFAGRKIALAYSTVASFVYHCGWDSCNRFTFPPTSTVSYDTWCNCATAMLVS